jgi:hypothetical protein
VRRSPCGLRRLTRNTGFLGLLAATCVLAAGAPAAPAPTLFRVTLVGTAHHEWAYTAAPVEDGACRRTEMTEGIRNATFRTSRPVVVRLLAGRVLPADLRGLAGRITLGGANTKDENCAGVSSSVISDCAQTKRSFTGGRARVASPRPGMLALGVVRNVRLRVADCPREPVEVMRRPLGPARGPLRLPKAALMERRLNRLTVRGSRTQRTRYASPEEGRLEERTEWTLTFVRIKD